MSSSGSVETIKEEWRRSGPSGQSQHLSCAGRGTSSGETTTCDHRIHLFSPHRALVWNNKDISYKHQVLLYHMWFGDGDVTVGQMFNQNDFLSHAEQFTPYRLLSVVSYLKTQSSLIMSYWTKPAYTLLMSSNSTEKTQPGQIKTICSWHPQHMRLLLNYIQLFFFAMLCFGG